MSFRHFTRFLFWAYSAALLTSIGAMELLGWVTFVTFLAQLCLDLRAGRKDNIRSLLTSFPILTAGIFFFFTAISAFFSPIENINPITPIGVNRSLFLVVAFAYLWRDHFLNVGKRYFTFVFGVSIFVCIYVIFQFFTSIDLIRGYNRAIEPIGNFFRPVGFFSNPLTLAYILGMFFFILLPVRYSHLLERKSWSRPLYFVTMIILAIGLFTTNARGAWISAFIAMNIFIYLLKSRRLFIFSFAVMISATAILSTHDIFRGRLTSIVDLSNISNSDRVSIWRANIDIIKENWTWGIGYNVNNNHIFPRYEKLHIKPPHLGPEHHAHSDLLQAFVGGGIPGLITYVLMIFSFLVMSYLNWRDISWDYRLLKMTALGLFLSQIFVHLGGLTQCNYTDREVNHVIMFVWAFTLVLSSPRLRFSTVAK